MDKHNRLLLLLKSLPLAVIFMFWFLKPHSLIYAQIHSSTATPTSSPKVSTSLTQASSSTEPWNPWEPIVAIGTILSGIGSILALQKSEKNGKDVKKNQLVEENNLFQFDKLIALMIKHTDEPTQRDSLSKFKKELENERRVLAKRVGAHKEAETWLKKNREQLAYDAINNALINESSVRKDVRDKFLSEINDYLHLIYSSLDIGDTDWLEEEVRKLVDNHALTTNSFYKKALEFILNKANTNTNLSQLAFKEMKYYFDYLMNLIP